VLVYKSKVSLFSTAYWCRQK